MQRIPKKFFYLVFDLLKTQPWISEKPDAVSEIINNRLTQAHKLFIIDLLKRFIYLTPELFDKYLQKLTDYIILGSGFEENKTQLVATAIDDEIDSSQWILQALKTKLVQNGWGSVKLTSKIGQSFKPMKTGRNQIILIDEFIGTGKTFRNRVRYVLKNSPCEIDLQCCVLAAMKSGLEEIRKERVEVFYALELNKGIDDFYKEPELSRNMQFMLDFEQLLKPEINGHLLSNYSLGFGKAQSLYSAEGCSSNTPNSVFPVFWWPKDMNNKKRKKLLTRFEQGLF